MNAESAKPPVSTDLPLDASAIAFDLSRSVDSVPDAVESPGWSQIETTDDQSGMTVIELTDYLKRSFETELATVSATVSAADVAAVSERIASEIDRICDKSDRIQTSGQVKNLQLELVQNRLQKCFMYYKLGQKRGGVELHSQLCAMVYRHVAPTRTYLGFQGRYSLLQDFLQSFYIEVLKAFRREKELPNDYCPRTRLEVAEYMAFSEQYAKRRINLPGRRNQQLIVLRAQGFASRQPQEASVDIEAAVESGRGEEAEAYSRSPLIQQVREQMVLETDDPADPVLRDRIINELIEYLEAQGQSQCVDYLVLKLQDLSAPEIDEILNLSPRERDYLQQRFKYHVEKFARSHSWQMVHQWLGADLDQNLGMSGQQWQRFMRSLTPDQHKLLNLKQAHATDQAIAKALKCTSKQVHKRWVKLLDLAWQIRNDGAMSHN